MRSLRNSFIVCCLCMCLTPHAYAAVHISEVYPIPELGNYEWVEITNTSNSPVDTKEYILRDKALHKLFLPHVILESGQFIIATSSGVLNNSGDTVELLLQETLLEAVTYPSGLTSQQSYTLCGDEWIITGIISPGFDNPSCLEEEVLPTGSPTTYATPTLSGTLTSQQNSTLYSNSFEPTRSVTKATRTIQSFTKKHALSIPTLMPTLQKTLATDLIHPKKNAEKSIKTPSPDNKPYAYMLVTVILLLLAIIIGISVYMTLKKSEKNSYNDIYDT